MIKSAKFQLGQVVRHRVYPFRGVIFDVDPTFNSTDEWYESIPEDIRPSKDQPFYHLFAENAHPNAAKIRMKKPADARRFLGLVRATT